MCFTVGTSLIKRLNYAKDTKCSAINDLNKLISNSEGNNYFVYHAYTE